VGPALSRTPESEATKSSTVAADGRASCCSWLATSTRPARCARSKEVSTADHSCIDDIPSSTLTQPTGTPSSSRSAARCASNVDFPQPAPADAIRTRRWCASPARRSLRKVSRATIPLDRIGRRSWPGASMARYATPHLSTSAHGDLLQRTEHGDRGLS
jgi:hypothetical protein